MEFRTAVETKHKQRLLDAAEKLHTSMRHLSV